MDFTLDDILEHKFKFKYLKEHQSIENRVKELGLIKRNILHRFIVRLFENNIIFKMSDLLDFFKYFEQENKDIDYLKSSDKWVQELEIYSVSEKIERDFILIIDKIKKEISYSNHLNFQIDINFNLSIDFSIEVYEIELDYTTYKKIYWKINCIKVKNHYTQEQLIKYNTLPSSIIKFTDRIKNK